MARDKGIPLSLEPRSLIEQFKGALTAEIESMKENPIATRWTLRNGRLVGREGQLYLYEFTLDTLFNGVPDDSPLMLKAGHQSTKGYVVSLVGTQLMLAVEESLGDSVNEATANVSPFWLLEQLRKKLDELDEEDVELPLKCISDVPTEAFPQTDSPSEVPAELNEWQARAVHLAITSEVSYIWGPPGTGKTRTLAALAKTVIEQGESVLITAHTNVAVDQAVKASLGYLKHTEYYTSGRILRLGTAQLSEVRDDKNLNLDAIVAKRSAPLQERVADLRSLVQITEERLSSLQRLKERIAELDALAAKRQEIDKSLEMEHGRIQEMQEERDFLAQSKAQAEEILERGQHMSWLGRVVRGINLQRLGEAIREHEAQLVTLTSDEKKLMKGLERLRLERQSVDRELRKAEAAFDKTSIDRANIEPEIARLQDEIAVHWHEIEGWSRR